MRTSGSYTANLLGTIRSHLAGLQGYDVMALELIQNADDAKAKEITFEIADDGLKVTNSGEFTYCGDLTVECHFQTRGGYSCDYHRIVDVASGGKLGQSGNIGRFGIGFVSTYQITDHPRIQSAGLSLILRPEASTWDLETGDHAGGTQFLLPWATNPNTKARQALGVSPVNAAHIDRLAHDLTDVVRRSLLFLRHVTRAEVRRNGKLLVGCDLDRGDGTDLIVSFRPGNEVEHWHILRADVQAGAINLYATHPMLKGLRRNTKISIGVRVDPKPLSEGVLYAFLPTEQPTGLPVHINADFFPEPDRKAVIFAGHQHEQAWNEMLVDAAAAELARDPERLRETLGDAHFWQLVNSAYELATRPTGYPPIFGRFWEHLKIRCTTASIVATQNGKVATPDSTLLPHAAPFSQSQAAALMELGARLASESLRPYRNAVVQLGAQLLTLDRLVSLIGSGLSAAGIRVGDQVAAERIQQFYEPLWSVLDELLPEPGAESQAAKLLIQRLRPLPILLSQDSYANSIDDPYLVPSPLSAERAAALLPKLYVASRGLSATKKLSRLVDVLNLSHLVSELAAWAKTGELTEALSTQSSDLRDLYSFFADLDVQEESDQSVYDALRTLPIWWSSRGLISAKAALLPGNFTDPSGVGDLLDTTVLSEKAREFVRTKLGVATQSIETFVKTVVPTFFGENGPANAAKYEALLAELANHPSLLDDEDARRVLKSLPMVPTKDGHWSRPTQTYRRTESLARVLGEADHLWLDKSRIPETRSVQSFLDSLGLRSEPLAEHLVARMISLAEDDPPTDQARRASAEAFYVLCDKFEQWKDASFFQEALRDLRQSACFPAEGDVQQWHKPASLYASYSAEAFRSQAKILDFRNTTRLKTPLLEALGVKINPETVLVVRHLQHCIKEKVRPSDVVYRVLNDRAAEDRTVIEVLGDEQCIYVEALKSFVHPNRLFWSPQQLGRFAFTIPTNLSSYRPLFDALGVTDGPESADYVRIIREISDEYFLTSKIVQGQDRAVFDSCWKALAVLHDRDALDAANLRDLREAATIVNVTQHLVDPDEVLIQDSEWYAGFFDGELDSALCRPFPELWPLFEEVGVRRLSKQARVVLEFTGGDEVVEPEFAATLAERSDLILRLLHDKPEVLRKAVRNGLTDLTAASFETVRIQASVQIGDDDDHPQPASPIRAHAYYDRDAHLLSIERPIGPRSWAYALNAILHQLIPDATGSEVPKLTLSLRPLMILSVEDGHRELTEAGVPELEDMLGPDGIEDMTSPELGSIGVDAETQGMRNDANCDEPQTRIATAKQHSNAGEGPLGTDLATEDHSTNSDAGGQEPEPAAEPSDHPIGAATPTNQSSPRENRPARAGTKTRPKYKVPRDRRLLSYVNHVGTESSDDESGKSQHNLAIEAAAREAVCKYEMARGRTPKRMPLTHPGYDIVSQDMVRGTQRLIEVKGVAGEWNQTGVGLSRLQFGNAQEYPEQFWLYVVEFVNDPAKIRIHPIAKPATQVTSFMFDGNWRLVVDDDPVDPALAFRLGVRVRHVTWGPGVITAVDVHGANRVLAVDFDHGGRQRVPANTRALSVIVEDDEDNPIE